MEYYPSQTEFIYKNLDHKTIKNLIENTCNIKKQQSELLEDKKENNKTEDRKEADNIAKQYSLNLNIDPFRK